MKERSLVREFGFLRYARVDVWVFASFRPDNVIEVVRRCLIYFYNWCAMYVDQNSVLSLYSCFNILLT